MKAARPLSLAACIRVSEDDEPIDLAVASIRRNLGFRWIFVESVAGRHRAPKENPSELDIQDVGNVHDAIPVECDAVVFIPPECSFTRVAFERLLKQTEQKTPYTHFTLRNRIIATGVSPFYGLLAVLAVIDQFWTWFTRGKHPRDQDVRMVNVITNGRHRHLAHRPWYWRLYNSGECSYVSSGRGSEVHSTLTGLALVKNVFKRHLHLMRASSWIGNAWLLSWYGFFMLTMYRVVPFVPLVPLACVYVLSASIFFLMANASVDFRFSGLQSALWPLWFVTTIPFAIVNLLL